jgi:hypothetical protein
MVSLSSPGASVLRRLGLRIRQHISAPQKRGLPRLDRARVRRVTAAGLGCATDHHRSGGIPECTTTACATLQAGIIRPVRQHTPGLRPDRSSDPPVGRIDRLEQ